MTRTIKPAQPPVVRPPSSDVPPARRHTSGPEHQGDQGDGWRGRESEPTARVAARAALLDAMRTSKAPTVLVTEDYQWGRLGRWSPELGAHMKENVACGEIPDSDVARQGLGRGRAELPAEPRAEVAAVRHSAAGPRFSRRDLRGCDARGHRRRGEPITPAALSDAFYSVLETTRRQRFDRAF